MYDEFERSLNSDRRSRSRVGTWILLGFAGFTFIGIAGAVAGFFAVRNQVERVVERVDVRVDVREIERALERLDRLEGLDRISGLENLAVANEPLGEAFKAMAMFRNVEPTLTSGPDARATRLRIHAGSGEIFIGTGTAAVPPPEWVPRAADRPADARQVFSARLGEGAFGAVSWKADGTPEAIVDAFRAALERDGFTLRGEGTHEDASSGSLDSGATVWAESENGERHVFVVAGRKAGEPTSVLLGYGERLRD